MDQERFFRLVGDRPLSELERIQRAYFLAKREHAPQQRDGGGRYFEHPRRVAVLLMESGYGSTDNVVAGLLHDADEDGYLPRGVIYDLLGAQTHRTIECLTKVYVVRDQVTGRIVARPKKPEAEYRAAIRTDPVGRIVKPADRLDNLKTCGVWEPARVRKYIAETREWILDLALDFAPEIGRLMQLELERLEATFVKTHP